MMNEVKKNHKINFDVFSPFFHTTYHLMYPFFFYIWSPLNILKCLKKLANMVNEYCFLSGDNILKIGCFNL